MRKQVLVLALALAGVALGAAGDSVEAKQGWLGVFSEELSEPMLIALDVKNGVVVTEVAEGSPAERAEIARGDVIVSVDGEAVVDVPGLRRIVRQRPEKAVSVALRRRGRSKNVTVKLAAREPAREPVDVGELDWFGLPGEALREARRAMAGAGPAVKRRIEVHGDALEELREELRALRRELDSLRRRLDTKN